MGETSSRLRQRIAELNRRKNELFQRLLSERGPLIRGTYGTRGRVCGKTGCRCTRGELHESQYLSASDRGKVRQVHVPAKDEVMVAEGVVRYRRFWQLRRRLAELGTVELELAERLGQSLLGPYPPDKPLPPARRRGRRRRKDQRKSG